MELKLVQQEVNWNQHHISGKDLQPDKVIEKFKLWDYVVENNLLSHDDQKVRDEAALLLEDDTIYEYAFFNNDKDEPFRYEAYQDLIAQCKYTTGVDDWKNVNRFVMFVASNQIGKSRFLIGKARKLLFTEHGKNIVIATNNLKLTQFILSEIKNSLNQSMFTDSWKEDIDEVNNTTMLTVSIEIDGTKYLNRLICTPAGEGSLGYPIHYLFLDELDFYENADRLFWKVFYPRLNKTKGQMFVFSNPNPDIAKSNSVLWNLWQGDLFKRKFTFNFLDASWNTLEEFEVAKRNSPAHIFASTHLGQWSDLSGAFFSELEIKNMLQKEWENKLFITDKPVYIGVDLGKMRDSTVISVGVIKQPLDERDKYMDLDVKYIEKMPLKTDYDIIADRIGEIRDYYVNNCAGVAGIGFDSTGQKTFGDFLKRMNISAKGVDFSAKESNKTLLYNNFKLMAENKKIKIVYTYEVQKQLASLEFKETAAQKLQKVENKTDTIHDDISDSLAILIHISVRPSVVPVSLSVVYPHEDKPKEIDKNLNAREQAIQQAYNTNKSQVNKYRQNHYNKSFGGII